jgi:hypothetical protein
MAGRLGVLGASVLKGSEGGLQRLLLDYIDVPLDDMLRSRTASRQCGAQVSQDLLDLRHYVVLAYYLSWGVDGILTADVHGLIAFS